MEKQIEKFEVVYFRNLDRDSFITDDKDYIEDLIDNLESWEYPFIEEVNIKEFDKISETLKKEFKNLLTSEEV